MIIVSKPLLMIHKKAFVALLKDLKYKRQSKPVNLIEQINKDVELTEQMLEVITNELKTKHNNG